MRMTRIAIAEIISIYHKYSIWICTLWVVGSNPGQVNGGGRKATRPYLTRKQGPPNDPPPCVGVNNMEYNQKQYHIENVCFFTEGVFVFLAGGLAIGIVVVSIEILIFTVQRSRIEKVGTWSGRNLAKISLVCHTGFPAIICPWLAVGFPLRRPSVVWCQGRFSHFLPRQDRLIRFSSAKEKSVEIICHGWESNSGHGEDRQWDTFSLWAIMTNRATHYAVSNAQSR